ncbi:MAG: hypothetical protein U1G07_13085 [Verrucomicrobiota bacterium]
MSAILALAMKISGFASTSRLVNLLAMIACRGRISRTSDRFQDFGEAANVQQVPAIDSSATDGRRSLHLQRKRSPPVINCRSR